MEIIFTNQEYLWFLFSIPLLVGVHFFSLKYAKSRSMKVAHFEAMRRVTGGQILSKHLGVLCVRAIVVILLIFAAAGTVVWYYGPTTNFDLVLAIDASSSMLAEDIPPNRLEAAKDAASLFIDSVGRDTEVAVISFAGASFVKQIPTKDLSKANKSILAIEVEEVGGTAIGEAILTSTNLLLRKEGKPKMVILITDGQNNVGISLEEAVKYANENHVTVNTIGIGTEGGGTLSNLTFTTKLDEEALVDVANSTGGSYHRATDRLTLLEAYEKLTTPTKNKISLNLSPLLLLLAIVLLFVEWGLISTKYRIIP